MRAIATSRIVLLFLANALLLAMMVHSASFIYQETLLESGAELPESSIVYEGRLLGYEYAVTGSRIDVTADSRATVYLVNTPTEVLSGALVEYEVPSLGLSGTLTEEEPGVYRSVLSARASFAVETAAQDVSSWQARLDDWALNGKRVLKLSFVDLVETSGFQATSEETVYEVPLHLAIEGRLFDGAGQPVRATTLSAALPDHGFREQVTTDADGRIRYEREEIVRLSVRGGELETLSSALTVPEVSPFDVVAFWGHDSPGPDPDPDPDPEDGLCVSVETTEDKYAVGQEVTIQGQVTDCEGSLVGGADVSIRSSGPDGAVPLDSSATTSDGNFSFSHRAEPPAGDYQADVTASKDGDSASGGATYTIFEDAALELELAAQHKTRAVPTSTPRTYEIYRRGGDQVETEITILVVEDFTEPVDYLVEVGLFKADDDGTILDEDSPLDSVERTVSVQTETVLDPPVTFDLADGAAVGYHRVRAKLSRADGSGSQQDDDAKDLAVIFNPDAGLAATFVEASTAQVWLNSPDAFDYALGVENGRVFKFAMDVCDGLATVSPALGALEDRTQFLVRWVESPEFNLDTVSGLAGCNVDDTADPANNDCYFGGRGQCFHYGDLMAGFLRTVGIAGRPTSGGIPPPSDPSNDDDYRVGAHDTDEAPGGNEFWCWNYHVWTEAHDGSWKVYDTNQDFAGSRGDYGADWIADYCGRDYGAPSTLDWRSDGLITQGIGDSECFDGAYGSAACPASLSLAAAAASAGAAGPSSSRAVDESGELAVELDAARYHLGQSVGVEVTATNHSAAAWEGELAVEVSGTAVAHPLVPSRSVPETVALLQETVRIEPGQTVTRQLTVAPSDYAAVGTGSYVARARALGLTAREHALMAGAVAVEIDAPSSVPPGTPVTVRAVVSNPTPGDLTGVVVDSMHPALESREIGALSAGASVELAWTFLPERAGRHDVSLAAGAEGAGLTIAQATVEVDAPAELQVYRVSLPPRVEVGETFEVHVDLHNPGRQPLGPVTVELVAETVDLIVVETPVQSLSSLPAESIETLVWTAVATAPGRVRLRAVASSGGLVAERPGATVSARPGHSVDLSVDRVGEGVFGGLVRVEVPTGDGTNTAGAGFEVVVRNSGELADTLRVAVTPDSRGVASFEEEDDEHWTLRELELGPGEQVVLRLQMRTWDAGASSRVSVRSLGDLTQWDRMTVRLDRNDDSALQVEPSRLDLVVDHGGSGQAVFEVTNRGDEPLYDVTLEREGDIASWMTLDTDFIAELAPGATAEVSLTVTVPRYQGPSAYTGSVRVSSGELADAVAVSVEVPEHHAVTVTLDPDSRSVVPGNTGIYGVEVRNEGNVSDTYDLTAAGFPATWEVTWTRATTLLLEPGAVAAPDLHVIPLRSPETKPQWHTFTVRAENEHAGQEAQGELEVLVFHEVDLAIDGSEVEPGPAIIVDKVWKKAHQRPHGSLDVIVQTRGALTDEQASVLEGHGLRIKRRYRLLDAVAARLPAGRLTEVAAEPFVARIELDERVEALPADGGSGDPLNTGGLAVDGHDGDGVVVAVVDTGIDADHPALPAQTPGYDFVNADADPDDDHGHGTHVAGIVASRDAGLAGVAPGATLMPVKVLDAAGTGSSSDVIAGVEWAVEQGADVINLSLGSSDTSDGTSALSRAVDNAVLSGVVVVAAAGNSGPDYETVAVPADAALAIAVGAQDTADGVAGFSSRGPTADGRVKPDVVAPGVDVVSTWPGGGFATRSGTSMAAPHVAGVAALLLDAEPTARPALIKEALTTTAVALAAGDSNTQGHGRVDADAAYFHVTQTLAAASASTEPGDTAGFDFRLTNLGNVADSFVLDASVAELPAGKLAFPPAIGESWTVLPPSPVGLASGEETGDVATVSVPEDWAGMEPVTYRFTLSATSQEEPAVGDREQASLGVEPTKRSRIEYVRLEILWLHAEITAGTPQERGLLAKLETALAKAERAITALVGGDLIRTETSLDAAINQIEAFLNSLQAQGKKLDADVATGYREKAEAILAHLLSARRTPVE